jgi:hypothetical protein
MRMHSGITLVRDCCDSQIAWAGMASPGDAATPAVPACQNRLDALNPYKQTIFSLLADRRNPSIRV